MSRLLNIRALLLGLVLGVLAAGAGFAIAQGGGEPGGPGGDQAADLQDEVTDLQAQGSELRETLAQMREEGLTDEEVPPPASVQALSERLEHSGVEELSLEVVAHANPRSVAACAAGAESGEFTGVARSGEGAEADAIYCNAILKIDAGELDPTGERQGRSIWTYSEDELRALAA